MIFYKSAMCVIRIFRLLHFSFLVFLHLRFLPIPPYASSPLPSLSPSTFSLRYWYVSSLSLMSLLLELAVLHTHSLSSFPIFTLCLSAHLPLPQHPLSNEHLLYNKRLFGQPLKHAHSAALWGWPREIFLTKGCFEKCGPFYNMCRPKESPNLMSTFWAASSTFLISASRSNWKSSFHLAPQREHLLFSKRKDTLWIKTIWIVTVISSWFQFFLSLYPWLPPPKGIFWSTRKFLVEKGTISHICCSLFPTS